MKKTILFLFTICTIGTLKANTTLTAQSPDKIIFKGEEYNLASNPLEHYFKKYPEKRPESKIRSTNLWRGYVAYFEIIDDELFVTDIKIEVRETDSEANYPYTWTSAFNEVFPNQDKVKVNDYSGILILPHGELIQYVHMGYASIYSDYWLLEIENGTYNEARKYNHKKFLQFKERQFEAFQKTEEYRRIYNDLMQYEDTEDDSGVKNFIADFVINYTSKFLSD